MSVRNNPFARNASTSPTSGAVGRPKSALFSSSTSPLSSIPVLPSHSRTQSHTSIAAALAPAASIRAAPTREGSRGASPSSNTFAPSFIKTEDVLKRADTVRGIEGENDFSGKKYVWLKDPQTAFVKGWVVEELGGNRILVQCDDGSVSTLLPYSAWLRGHLLTCSNNSNERLTARASIKSTRPSSTKRTTWQS
ncbi:hypothetical protein B0T24DRAFT_423260 [Lasiosphaeria ovina]|uniref:Myosin N-terminal SH3-like domain-containing protein n=1 Tax=Lasiosphaeria ovina TaxID=92902 RepID=A0AAE0MZA7_9PEZI|nr:hypothetical protein B0T24DRAFT_423260 [Lasiosphaeria ovina]